ncbi:MAG: thioredoxin domain-containing protein [candidate division WOR-3 bacterium]|nr:thioredoxin domain-containing protein [candidate division WOR-3 bacterium]
MKKAINTYYKIGIVITVIIIVVFVIILKSVTSDRQREVEHIGDSEVGMDSTAMYHSQLDTSLSDNRSEAVTDVDSLQKKQGEPEGESPTPARNVLATVNGEELTLTALNKEFNALPPQAKEYFKDDKAGFLEELIVKRLLLQDARRKKISERSEYKTASAQNSAQKEQLMINILLRELVANVSITESELREFFDRNKDQFPHRDYESLKEQVRPNALEEKQRLVIEGYINELQANAAIVRNGEWIKEQEAAIADNPLSRALRSGRPVVADFGRGTCIPCKMMLPILEKLQKEYAGRAEILILDVGEYASLSRKYGVMMIPTQIFFDSSGREVNRHQGFMAEEDIVAQLKKMGVE